MKWNPNSATSRATKEGYALKVVRNWWRIFPVQICHTSGDSLSLSLPLFTGKTMYIGISIIGKRTMPIKMENREKRNRELLSGFTRFSWTWTKKKRFLKRQSVVDVAATNGITNKFFRRNRWAYRWKRTKEGSCARSCGDILYSNYSRRKRREPPALIF